MKLGMFLSPGSYPDKPLADVVDWYERVVRRAEELDYDEIWIASHTTNLWARISSPLQLISRLLAVTERIKLGPAVEVLYQHHPVTVAANLAELDQISKGRMLFGFGAGGPVGDLQTYALPGNSVREMSNHAHAMMLEAIDIVLNCWQEGGPQPFEGKFWKVGRPTTELAKEAYQHAEFHNGWHLSPYAPVEDRIAVAGFSPRSVTLGLAGERGFIPLSWSISREFAKAQWDSLLEGADRSGRTPRRSSWRQAQVVYVAETDREARDAVVNGFATTFWDRYWLPIFIKNGAIEYFRRRAGNSGDPSTGELIDKGIWLVGTPDRVAAQLREQYEACGGFGTLMQIGFDYAGAGAAGWMRSMELLAREVMPKVRDLVPADRLSVPA